jgi:hypothetical protein
MIFGVIEFRIYSVKRYARKLETQVEERTLELSTKKEELEIIGKKLEKSNRKLEKQMKQKAEFYQGLSP